MCIRDRLMTVIQTDTKTALTDNAYFIHHPERIVHTTSKLDTDPYGKPAMVYLHEGKTAGIAGDLRRMLNEDFHYLSLIHILEFLSNHVKEFKKEDIAFYKARIHNFFHK